ncbi:zinc-dependent metalloprotease [Corynebacterium pseudotuberculosis]|uniref:Hydrolase n=1 Tax=Corynebacterium pseudotuberculosis 258 TaxID=1168865 RepID=A0AAU8PKM2_CORPS|nr:zinc-dependent metalloprotease [Corynebacterium pseudotuberculosis]AEQ06109.1 hydrolase [Corynebacterium pseudotuberculosis CIP 52.97]AFH90385.2 hydrolase [Corynebacterium pseudotuberculosis 31]AFK16197.1 hydrolase [Corynebacterium pseudotuberculosis 258]APB10508.1 hydrolase [Corynebacterium pseudotuberculosis]APB12555.1 hydrolase [Corynebacterium pseudotuberculosis]
MNTNGFGFSFNFGGNGDDDNNGRNNNPFGAGGLGDMLNQFGQMLSGMGSTMNSPEGQGPVNYALAERIARQQIGSSTAVSDNDTAAVEEAVRLVEIWLDDATILPASGNTVAAWDASLWLEQTLPMWKRLVTPVAENMAQAQVDSLPEEAREMVGPMMQIMNQMSGMNFGMQLGHALGDLATQTIAGTDFGLPIAPTGVTALLPANLRKETSGLKIEDREVIVYLSAREAARQRLFKHVPWLRERLVSSVEEYATGLVIDTSHIEEAMRDLNLESGDPAAIQNAMEQLQGLDMSPRITSRNSHAASRLETLLALIEGWVEIVVTEAMGNRIPSTAALNEAWRRRRATGGSAEQAFAKVVGIEFAAPKVAEAQELWRRVGVAVGTERRDHVWDHPDFLPTAEDLESSAEFIDALLDDSSGSDFDPIAEITKLEEMLASEGENPESKENPKPEDDTDDQDPKKP